MQEFWAAHMAHTKKPEIEVVRRGTIAGCFARISKYPDGKFAAEFVRYSRLDGEQMIFHARPFDDLESAWNSLVRMKSDGLAEIWPDAEFQQVLNWINGGPWPALWDR